jgi:hypothetical protein
LEIIHQGRPRRLQTLFGPIRLRRRYYYHTRAHCGRCPLDHALDLVGGTTPGLARLICRASTQSGSYEEAAEDLRAYTGLRLKGRHFGRLVREVIPSLRQAQAAQPAVAGSGIPLLYLASDGTGVAMRREELAGVRGRQPDGRARTREVKLGCVFTQTSLNEEGEPVRDPDSTTYVGTFEDCRHLGGLLRAEAFRRGYARAVRTVYLGDGAPWIWENARLNFPDAVQILDFYHASEHAGVLAAALLGAGAPAQALQHRWCQQMKETSSAPMVSEAQQGLAARRALLEAEARQSVEREIGYFQTNAARTRYGDFRAQGYFIGSGVVEAGCKTAAIPKDQARVRFARLGIGVWGRGKRFGREPQIRRGSPPAVFALWRAESRRGFARLGMSLGPAPPPPRA